MQKAHSSFARWLYLPLLATVGGCAHPANPTATPAPPVKSGSLFTRGPYVQSVTGNAATIRWEMAQPTPFTFEAKSGIVPAQVQSQGTPSRPLVRLGALKPGTLYDYEIRAGDTTFKSHFQTAKPPGQACTFAVWGDSGAGSQAQWQLAKQIEKTEWDFLLHTGDLIYPRGEAADYDAKFFKPYANLLARAPFYGALGNHDVVTQNGQPFLDTFVFPANGPAKLTPERNFTFDWGDARVAVLDSNAGEQTFKSIIAPWLIKTMSASRPGGPARWKIVAFHHAPFSSGFHGDDSRIQRALVPVFEKLKIDVVFNGHDHLYERFAPRGGVLYIVSGAGGANRYAREQRSRAQSASFFNADWSFTRVDMTPQALRGQQITREGNVVDEWTLEK